MSSKFIFLSHTLSSGTPGYGGQKQFLSKRVRTLSEGHSCNQSEWHLNNHIGTHIDAPFHFSENGATVDSYDADFWFFNKPQLCVLPAEPSTLIDVGAWCETVLPDTDLLLIKTGFEEKRDSEVYWKHNPGLSPKLGEWLRCLRPQVRVVGFDFISITSYDHRDIGKIAHRAFLHEELDGHPILAIEDMHLAHLESSPKSVVVAPLRIENSDGSPVTVMAEV